MEKVIRNGNVAVLISGDYGAGWSTWNRFKELLFHPKLVELVEQDKQNEITEELCQKLLNTKEYICVLGAPSLHIEWIEEGTAFTVNEYDGAESIQTKDDLTFTA